MKHSPISAGSMTHRNTWQCVSRFPLVEWARWGDQWLHICGWAVLSQKLVEDFVEVTLFKKNLVVDSGVTNSLDFQFGLGTPSAAITIGVDDGASNPVAGTDDSTTGSTNRRLVTFDTNSRAAKVVSSSGSFDEVNVTFIIKRLFLSRATAGTTDSAGDLVAMTDVFTHDNTPFTEWDATYTLEYTGAGS